MAIAWTIDRFFDMEPYKLQDFITYNKLTMKEILDEAKSEHTKNPHDDRLEMLIELLNGMRKDNLWNAIHEIKEEIMR